MPKIVFLAMVAASVGTAAAPALAQMDPTIAGQGAVLTEMKRRNAQRLTGRAVNPYGARTNRADRRAASASDLECSNVAELEKRRGSLSEREYRRYWTCTHR